MGCGLEANSPFGGTCSACLGVTAPLGAVEHHVGLQRVPALGTHFGVGGVAVVRICFCRRSHDAGGGCWHLHSCCRYLSALVLSSSFQQGVCLHLQEAESKKSPTVALPCSAHPPQEFWGASQWSLVLCEALRGAPARCYGSLETSYPSDRF